MHWEKNTDPNFLSVAACAAALFAPRVTTTQRSVLQFIGRTLKWTRNLSKPKSVCRHSPGLRCGGKIHSPTLPQLGGPGVPLAYCFSLWRRTRSPLKERRPHLRRAKRTRLERVAFQTGEEEGLRARRFLLTLRYAEDGTAPRTSKAFPRIFQTAD